ncbi:MAG: hypothetical protein ACI4NA_01425, partial [Succinivibrio sp.]
MEKNKKELEEGEYRSFTMREQDTDYSRWTLLRQADKSATLTAAKAASKPRTSGGVTFSAPQKKELDLFAPGALRSQTPVPS